MSEEKKEEEKSEKKSVFGPLAIALTAYHDARKMMASYPVSQDHPTKQKQEMESSQGRKTRPKRPPKKQSE